MLTQIGIGFYFKAVTHFGFDVLLKEFSARRRNLEKPSKTVCSMCGIDRSDKNEAGNIEPTAQGVNCGCSTK